MERLEERVVLSTLTWTGADSTSTTPGNWSDAHNWQGNVAPVSGDTLVFPTGLSGAALTSNDDISGGSFGSLTIQGGGYSIASTQAYGVALSGSIDASLASGSSTLDLPVDFGATAGSVTVDNAGATLVMGDAIAGTNGLTTAGSGTLDLKGTNTVTGTTTVAGGTLLVDGTLGDVAVGSSATVGGTGTVASVTTTAGTVSPGDSATATGILTDSGALTLDSSSNFNVTINGATAGTNYDQVSAGGAISLADAALNVTLGSLGSFTPVPGDQFTILHNTSGTAIPDTFNNLPEGSTLAVSGIDFTISYVGGTDSQDVVLTTIAAPTITWSGAGTDTNWSDGNNWVGGTAPVAGETLIFPPSPTGGVFTSTNDMPGTTFSSLEIQGDGYTISPAAAGDGIGLAGTIDASGSSASTVSLPITFNPGAGTVTVDNSGATLDLTGVVAATSGLTKDGAGTLDLAANDGTVAATVGAGTLLVDGTAGAVAVSSGATVGGSGTVASIASTSGTVSPGDSSMTTGVLTDSGALTLDSGSSFDATINGTTVGTNYDQLSAGGAVSLAGATLNIATGSFVATPGESFTILHNTSGSAISGTFANLPDGSLVTASSNHFVISYQGGSDGQDVVLTAVTPPIDTWSGADSTSTTPGNWSDANNWVGGAAPVSGDTIVFPAGLTGAALTSNDDISGGSFSSVIIQGGGYTIASTQGYGVTLSGLIDASYGSGSTTFSLPVDFGGGAATVTVDNQSAGLVLGGVLSDATGLTKQGSGVLDVKGTSTYSGTTTVAAGALLVDGSVGAVAVSSGATIGGSGTVASITTTAGTVSPGDSSAITGILTDSGALTLDPSSNFDVTINGTGAGTNFDQVSAGGAINLDGAALNISTGSFNPVPGATFTILLNNSGSAITGTFGNVGSGGTIVASGHTFSISYTGGTDGRDVVLTAVSPPTVTWSGTDAAKPTDPNDNWSDPLNWVGGSAPVAGDTIIFPASPTGGILTSNNDITGTTFYSLDIQASGYTITGDAIVLAGQIDSSQGSSSSTVSLPITFNPGAGTTTVDNSGATLLLSGVVTATSGLNKQGQGTLSLEANDGTLPAIVNAGTLLVDGAIGDVTANTGSTIGGKGTVGAVTTVGATLSPGDSSTATGILTDNGNLVLDSNSTFDATLDGTTAGTGYDQVVVGGSGSTINLNNATLSVTLGSAFPTNGGQKYTILSNTTGSPITGIFSGLAEGGTLTVGSSQFSITYKGGSDGQDVVLTDLLTTTTTVSPVTTRPVSGQSITLTATVMPGTGSGTPTGSVAFLASINGSSVSLGSATLNASGVATLTTTQLTAGTDTITATYSGDTTYGTSTSGSVAVVVSQASSTAALTASPSPSVVGQPVTLTATISAQSPGSGTPTGTVQFYDGSTALGSAVTVTSGVAVYTTTSLPVGTDSITAVYSGDTNFNTSTSQAVNVVVTQATATVSISTSNSNPFALQSITLTAIVSAPPGSSTPTGTVTFQTSDGTTLGTATLSSGAATLTTSSLPIGQQSITAVYSGSTSFLTATSPALSIVDGHPSDLYVNQVYLDVFGVPGGYNSTYWIALLNSGYSRKFVTRQILQSQQAKESAAENVYESLLHRPATRKELRQAASSGNTSTTPLYIKVFGSKEFYRNEGGGTDDGFLTALAQDWFGAPFSASVQARLSRQLAHGTSRSAVAGQVITSPSGVKAEVNTIIEGVLGRPATRKDDRTYAPLIRQGNMVAVYETLFTSREFLTTYVYIV
jgi:autotransporter-associated beta strand protein